MKRVITAITAALLLATIPTPAQAPETSFTNGSSFACSRFPLVSGSLELAWGGIPVTLNGNPDGLTAERRSAWETAARICDSYGRDGDTVAKVYACETADELAVRIRALPVQSPSQFLRGERK